MKKILYLVIILILSFAFSLNVNAARGDLIYEVESVSISDYNIKISGYAFIHRTQNYAVVYKRNADGTVDKNTIVKNNGGQKVKIRVEDVDNPNNYLEKVYDDVDDNYNFYYQMFYKSFTATEGEYYFDVGTYNNAELNRCNSDNEYTQCYYEDLGFNISFSVEELLNKFSDDTKLKLYIAAYNNDYGKYTAYYELKIPMYTGKSDYIEVTRGEARSGNVDFIALNAILRNRDFTIPEVDIYGCSDSGSYSNCAPTNYSIYKLNEGNFIDGTIITTNSTFSINGRQVSFLRNTRGPRMYALCVQDDGYGHAINACSEVDKKGYCIDCSGKVMLAYGSWIELTGTNQLEIKIKDLKKCDVTVPSSGALECNNSKTFNSICNELTVRTDKGSTVVKIEQSGTVSSILTPSKIYAGGGFNLGITYYNTIKWSYVNGVPSSQEFRDAIEEQMQRKIKDYEEYTSGLKITELKLDGKSYDDSFLAKKCTTNNANDKYYNKELTVSCVFYFPESTILQNGNVSYKYGAVGEGISNKFYTDINDNGNFKIEAKISGMDRITSNSSKSDSKDKTKGWTGDWSDTFENCTIEVYPLLVCPDCGGNGGMSYKFIYRPIDISNPFPNRNPGINWFEWYSIERNKDRLENTYSELQYVANLDNKAIADIKKYNKEHNYLDWDSINSNTEKSSFITDNDYIVRVGGNQ